MAGLKTAINIAAEQAAKEAEEMMTAVMVESIRMLRDELRGEIQDVTEKMQELATSGKIPESPRKEPASSGKENPAAAVLTAASSSASTEKLQALEAEQKTILSNLEKLTSRCDAQFLRIPTAPATRDDLDRMKDLMDVLAKEIQGVQAKPAQQQDAQPKPANTEHIDKKVTDLQAQLSQMKKDLANLPKAPSTPTTGTVPSDQLSELKAQLQELRTKLSEGTVPADALTRADLEALRKTTWSELKTHGDNNKDNIQKKIAELQIDKKISEVQGQASQIKSELEAKLSELKGLIATPVTEQLEKQTTDLQAQLTQIKNERVNVQLSEIRGQIKKMQTQLSEPKASSEAVTPRDVDAKVAATKDLIKLQVSGLEKQLSEMKSTMTQLSERSKGQSDSAALNASLSELRGQGQATKDHVDKKVSELQESLSKLKGEQEAALSKLGGSGSESNEAMQKQVSDLQADLSQMKSERVSVQLSEIRGQIKKLMTQSAEQKAPADAVTRSDLESVKEQVDKTISELQGQGPAAKEQVEKQITDLQSQVSQMKGERVNDQLSEVRSMIKKLMTQSESNGSKDEYTKQISDLSAQVSQIKGERISDQLTEMRGQMKKIWTQVSDRSALADFITRSDLETTRAAIVSELGGQKEAPKPQTEL